MRAGVSARARVFVYEFGLSGTYIRNFGLFNFNRTYVDILGISFYRLLDSITRECIFVCVCFVWLFKIYII